MKLDVTCMRYLTKEDYRVLVAVEMGMRNHEMVPVELIASIAQLRHGGSYKFLSTLLKFKLVAHERNEYDGYRLSYLGRFVSLSSSCLLLFLHSFFYSICSDPHA
jgi:RIO kinase 2